MPRRLALVFALPLVLAAGSASAGWFSSKQEVECDAFVEPLGAGSQPILVGKAVFESEKAGSANFSKKANIVMGRTVIVKGATFEARITTDAKAKKRMAAFRILDGSGKVLSSRTLSLRLDYWVNLGWDDGKTRAHAEVRCLLRKK